MERVLGYLRVSTEEQSVSGLGLDAQREAVSAEATRRGWEISWVEDAGYSAKNLNRPGISRALEELRTGKAETIVVSKLDRLSRSLIDFASLLTRAQKEGWGVVALDLGMDTTSINGRLIHSIVMAIAEWERLMIGKRTRDALAAKKRRGIRLGRPRSLGPEVEARALELSSKGRSLRAIAAALGCSPSTVRDLLRRARKTPPSEASA